MNQQMNNAKRQYLLDATGELSGNIDDLELLYFQNKSLETGQINQLKVTYYENLGFYGNLNDMEKDWLNLHGYTEGTINDRWLAFYQAGVVPIP